MKIQNVKGCIDYLPEEQEIRNNINHVLKNTFLEYGFLSIETPILMPYDLLSGKYDEGSDILKEIYKLSDQGKRNLGLRYDLTVPFAKFIALNKNRITFPFKRYEIAKVFRDGPVKLGRDREFTQCDADVVGLSGQMVEAECLSLYVDAFKKLGIDIVIQYNSRNLMIGLMEVSNIPNSLSKQVITIVDKMDKISKEEFVNQVLDLGIAKESVDKLLKYFKLSFSSIKDEFQDTEISLLKLGIEELSNLEYYINELEIDKYCVFTPTLARGQDYYTGNVFEVYEANKKLTCAIGGGGRYDKMITDFIDDGEIYPAVGISFGLTSIYELMLMNRKDDTSSLTQLYMIPMDDNCSAITLKLANKLRRNGIRVIVEMNHKKVKKCFEWANKRHIPYVTVIGEDEINNQTLSIKDMTTGDNKEYSFQDITKFTGK